MPVAERPQPDCVSVMNTLGIERRRIRVTESKRVHQSPRTAHARVGGRAVRLLLCDRPRDGFGKRHSDGILKPPRCIAKRRGPRSAQHGSGDRNLQEARRGPLPLQLAASPPQPRPSCRRRHRRPRRRTLLSPRRRRPRLYRRRKKRPRSRCTRRPPRCAIDQRIVRQRRWRLQALHRRRRHFRKLRLK